MRGGSLWGGAAGNGRGSTAQVTPPPPTPAGVKAVNVGADGNCFYRAGFNGLKSIGQLERACRALFGEDGWARVRSGGVSAFIRAARQLVAGAIAAAAQDEIAGLCRLSPDNFAAAMEGQPQWMRSRFPPGSPQPTEQELRELYASRAARPGTYVAEIDVRHFERLLAERAQLQLVVLNSVPSALPADGARLYLYCMHESHYQYLKRID